MGEKIITKSDRKQFIRDVSSCDFYNKKIIFIRNELEYIHNKLAGVKSAAPKNYIIENKKPYSNYNMLELICKEEKLIRDIIKYEDKINEVRFYFDQLPFLIQNIMVDMYMININHTKVASKYKFDRSYMYRLVNKSIDEVLKK